MNNSKSRPNQLNLDHNEETKSYNSFHNSIESSASSTSLSSNSNNKPNLVHSKSSFNRSFSPRQSKRLLFQNTVRKVFHMEPNKDEKENVQIKTRGSRTGLILDSCYSFHFPFLCA